jgi:hypothetical protein
MSLFIWQPILLYGDKVLDKFENAMVEHPALLSTGDFREKDGVYQQKALTKTYQLIENSSFKEFNFYNLSRVFDNVDEPIYIDWMHLGPRGNEIVANKISNIIREAFRSEALSSATRLHKIPPDPL